MCKTSWLALSPPLRLIFIYSSLGDVVLKHVESLGNVSPSRLHEAKSSRSCTPTTSRTCLRRLKADQRKMVFLMFLYGSVLTVVATRSNMFHWFALQV